MFDNEKIKDFDYGINTQQRAALYKTEKMAEYEILSENELTYQNILDLTTAVNLAAEFYDVDATVFVQNALPCAVALGKDLFDSYQRAFDCDPVAAFSSAVAFTKKVDERIALHLKSMAITAVVAPDFEEKAVKQLLSNENIRIIKLKTSFVEFKNLVDEEIKSTPFGLLVQDDNRKELDKGTFKVVTKAKPTPEQIEDAVFAWKIVKHAKSDAVVVAKDFKTMSIAQGFSSRVAAVESALDNAYDGSKDGILACDAPVPAIDSIQAALQGRIALVIQPGGLPSDKEVIKIADKYNLAMITTGITNIK